METKHPGREAGVDPFACERCGRPWSNPAEKWRTLPTDDNPPSMVAFCASCAELEFGWLRSLRKAAALFPR